MRQDSSTLIETKLRVPVLPGNLLDRPRLLSYLERALESKLTIVSAPAGFGKSTLMSQWVSKAGWKRSR